MLVVGYLLARAWRGSLVATSDQEGYVTGLAGRRLTVVVSISICHEATREAT